jgi:hypothetical protein
MRGKSLKLSLCCLLLGVAGCDRRASKPTEENQASVALITDACVLLTKEEVESVQGSPITETTSSSHVDGPFRTLQCSYTAETNSKSVVLSLTRRDPVNNNNPREFWRATFGRNPAEESEKMPQRITGLGDDAHWVATALYILKGDAFISISAGPDDGENKLKRSKALAEKAVNRF